MGCILPLTTSKEGAMTQAMQQFIQRLERLPAAVQDRYIRRFSKELEEGLPAEQETPSE